MAGDYRVLKTSLKQTAYNVAGTIVAGELSAGLIDSPVDVLARIDTVATDVFNALAEEADKDNEFLAAQQAAAPAAKSYPKKSGGGASKDFSLDDALSLDLRNGAFKGLTLGTVWEMSADECKEYGYTGGDGRKYFEYLCKNDKNTFVQSRAQLIKAQLGGDA
jgi:hypothetical protein